MEKTTITKKSKLISIACIIAILLAMCCQFISGWQFSGTITNANTRETRAMDMEMSLSSFVWKPYTEEATAFKNYINDPSLKISEEIIVNKDLSAEEYDGVGMIFGYADTKEKYGIDRNDVVIATYELDNASTQQVVFDSSYNRDEVIAKAAEEAAAVSEEEVAEEEPEEAPAEEVVGSDAVTTNSNMMVAVTESHIDPIGDSQNTVLSKSVDKEAALESYKEYAGSIGTSSKEQASFINGIVKMPALLLILELLAIALIILKMRKGKGEMFAAIATFLVGVLNIYYFYSQPIFLLFQEGSFSTIDTILSLVTILGFILTVESFNFKAWSKGILRFTKSRTFVALISGVVSSVIGILLSKVLVVGAVSGINSLILVLGVLLLLYGVLSILKAIVNAAKDNARAKRA